MPKFYNKMLTPHVQEKLWGVVIAEDVIDAKYKFSLKYRDYWMIGNPVSKDGYKAQILSNLDGYKEV